MENNTNLGRRRFLGMAAITLAAAELAGIGMLKAETLNQIVPPANNTKPELRAFEHIKTN